MLAPWPDWTAKTLASPDAACCSGDTTWKLGGVRTGGIDFDNETWDWEEKATDNLLLLLLFLCSQTISRCSRFTQALWRRPVKPNNHL